MYLKHQSAFSLVLLCSVIIITNSLANESVLSEEINENNNEQHQKRILILTENNDRQLRRIEELEVEAQEKQETINHLQNQLEQSEQTVQETIVNAEKSIKTIAEEAVQKAKEYILKIQQLQQSIITLDEKAHDSSWQSAFDKHALKMALIAAVGVTTGWFIRSWTSPSKKIF